MSLKFYPSAADRWLNCPGSVVLSKDSPYRPSAYAAEGTVAHSLAEDCLRLGLDPSDFVGEKRSADGYEFEIDHAMAEAVRIYVDQVERFAESGEWVIAIETRLESLELLSGLGPLSGRFDFFAYRLTESGVEVALLDLKFGAGVSVDAEDNPQLKTYALIASEWLRRTRGLGVSMIQALIIQPRAADGLAVKTALFSLESLERHREDIARAAQGVQAYQAATELEGQLEQLRPGDWCRWCPAKATCPRLHEEALAQARKDFGELPLLESPAKLSRERLLFWLEHAKTFEDWIDSIREHAKTRLESGEELQGWKLVESIGNRRWAGSEEEVEKSLRKAGFKKKDLFETRLLSPAQVEKVAPVGLKKSEAKEIVDALTIRPAQGLALVSAKDKRPAVSRSRPEDDFKPLSE